MKSILIQSIFLILMGIIIFNFEISEARGGHARRRYDSSSSSESSSESSSSSEERHRHHHHHGSGRVFLQGRGLFDSIKNIGEKAFDKAKSTDWKKVATDAKNKGKDLYKKLKSRRKRSFETMPMPVEQLLESPQPGLYFEGVYGSPKSLYNKRSVRKFDTKAYLDPKNQLF